MAEAFPGGSKQSGTAVCRRLVKWDSRRTNLFKSGSAGEPLQTSDSHPKSRRERDEEEEAAGFQVHHHFQQHESPLFAPSPLAAATASTEYGQLLLHPPPSLAQRLQSNPAGVRGMRGAGEIVEVQGGHIVRSTGRKDRHSKVCTAKGPRDRRVRLAAHTAIQFYDVQDRLGYDRPSKAVDWLMKNAKAAIDELAELPAWHPTAGPQEPYNPSENPVPAAEPASSPSFSFAVAVDSRGRSGHPISNFLPPSLDSDSIADTIKSFFPVTAADESAPAPPPSSISQVGFQSYPSDLLSSACSQSQDLRLSLQSFQDSTFHHSPALNPASVGFSEPNLRMISIWNTAAGGGGSDDYIFNKSPAVFGQGQLFSQRGTLQSSNMPFIRPWVDTIGNEMQEVLNPSASSFGFASSSGFRIPARIQGEEELGGVSDKQASGSFASNHQ